MRVRNGKISSRGQAMVEFLVSSVVMFFFLYLMVSVSILLVTSEYIEYATFMAARAYKAGYSRELGQRDHARRTFDQYFDRVSGGQLATLQSFDTIGNADNEKGIVVKYQMPLFYLPPVFLPGEGGSSRIDLAAEVRMGRDPSADVCTGDSENFFLRFVNSQLGGALIDPVQIAEQMEDNGC